MISCIDCEWQGEPKDALEKNGIDYCPDCGELVEAVCDEPHFIQCSEDWNPNAETK